jgi:hypothetical protein
MRKVGLVILMGISLIMSGLGVHFYMVIGNQAFAVVVALGILIFLFFLSGFMYKPKT